MSLTFEYIHTRAGNLDDRQGSIRDIRKLFKDYPERLTPPDDLLRLLDWFQSEQNSKGMWRFIGYPKEDFTFSIIFSNAFKACVDSMEFENIHLLILMLQKLAIDMGISLNEIVNQIDKFVYIAYTPFRERPVFGRSQWGPVQRTSLFMYAVGKPVNAEPGSTLGVSPPYDVRIPKLLLSVGFKPKESEMQVASEGTRELIRKIRMGGTRRRKRRRRTRRGGH